MKRDNLVVLPSKPATKNDTTTLHSNNILEFPQVKKNIVDYALRDALFEKAVRADQSGNLEAAVVLYKQVIQVDPNNASTWVNLGTIAFHKRDWEYAERCYSKALEIDPNYPLTHYNLGTYFDECNQDDMAEAYYLIALKLDPGYVDAHYNLGLLYSEMGKYEQALHHLEAYLKGSPKTDPWYQKVQREIARLKNFRIIESSS